MGISKTQITSKLRFSDCLMIHYYHSTNIQLTPCKSKEKLQSRRKVWKSRGANSYVVGIIYPPDRNRVNDVSVKIWKGDCPPTLRFLQPCKSVPLFYISPQFLWLQVCLLLSNLSLVSWWFFSVSVWLQNSKNRQYDRFTYFHCDGYYFTLRSEFPARKWPPLSVS